MLLIRFVVDFVVCRSVITKEELVQNIITLTVKNSVHCNWFRVLLYLINVIMNIIIYSKCRKDTKINDKGTSLILNMPWWSCHARRRNICAGNITPRKCWPSRVFSYIRVGQGFLVYAGHIQPPPMCIDQFEQFMMRVYKPLLRCVSCTHNICSDRVYLSMTLDKCLNRNQNKVMRLWTREKRKQQHRHVCFMINTIGVWKQLITNGEYIIEVRYTRHYIRLCGWSSEALMVCLLLQSACSQFSGNALSTSWFTRPAN